MLKQPVDTEVVDITVLTPAFFARFVHYADTMEAFLKEMLCPVEENKTIDVSKPDLLAKIFAGSSGSRLGKHDLTLTVSDLIDSWRWLRLRALRTPPPPTSYIDTIKGAVGPATPATPQYPFAPIDQYVADKCGRDGVARYRAAVTELFLSNRFALGDPAILHAYDLLVRVALLFVTARYVFADSAPGGGAGPPVAGVTGLVGLLTKFWVYNGANVWAFVKGVLVEDTS